MHRTAKEVEDHFFILQKQDQVCQTHQSWALLSP